MYSLNGSLFTATTIPTWLNFKSDSISANDRDIFSFRPSIIAAAFGVVLIINARPMAEISKSSPRNGFPTGFFSPSVEPLTVYCLHSNTDQSIFHALKNYPSVSPFLSGSDAVDPHLSRFFRTCATALTVASICSSAWAVERNSASNWEGAMYTPCWRRPR